MTIYAHCPRGPGHGLCRRSRGASEETLKAIRKEFGLDKSLSEQLFIYGKISGRGSKADLFAIE
ncbi:MAG: hypothetical protein QME78_08215 [Thermodesulfobacteriota bacterium]|nr:hypothetical protein [Thermodesulfobacteriota bacterium]